MKICSQRGCHPHEMYEEHLADGGVGQLTLVQYDPPIVETFDICQRCAFEIFEFFGYSKDPRFKWIEYPTTIRPSSLKQ